MLHVYLCSEESKQGKLGGKVGQKNTVYKDRV